MQRILTGIILSIVSIFFPNSPAQITITPTPLISPQSLRQINQDKIEVEYDQRHYIIYYTKISEKRTHFIPNFSEKLSAKEIVKQNNCQTAVNGGFYSKDSQPLGLYINNGNKLSDELTNSALLNGYVFLDENKTLQINNKYPQNISNIIQSGPYIMTDKSLNIINDEFARRIVIVKSATNDIYILAVVLKEDMNSGPKLADLPGIIYSVKLFSIDKALNLDGGSASFYFSNAEFIFEEYTNIGSVICID